MTVAIRYYLFFLAALCLLESSDAFQAATRIHQSTSVRSSGRSRRFLHPDQAAELEACAYDLTKEFVEEQRRKEATLGFEYNYNPMDHDSAHLIPEPVAWCRRLWPFAKDKRALRP